MKIENSKKFFVVKLFVYIQKVKIQFLFWRRMCVCGSKRLNAKMENENSFRSIYICSIEIWLLL